MALKKITIYTITILILKIVTNFLNITGFLEYIVWFVVIALVVWKVEKLADKNEPLKREE